jgi:predicted ABC-type ATPase
MFAGPNGSGKSTIKSLIRAELLGVYLNPDDLEAEIRRRGFLDLRPFQIQTTAPEILTFFQNAPLLQQTGLAAEAAKLAFDEQGLNFSEVAVNAYFASVAADFMRQQLLLTQQSFSFETVMSSSDKVALLSKARQAGYRNYLYFVATNDPVINIARVKQRVNSGGHDVPVEKITTRYHRSLDLLWEAIKHTNRAYIFDNSGSSLQWLAEITEAEQLELKGNAVPLWFKQAVLDKVG